MDNRFTENNITLIKKWMEYLSNGHFGNAKDIVDTYNTVFKDIKHKQNYTNCGSCLRRYVKEMYNALLKYEEKNKVVEADATSAIANEIKEETTEWKKEEKTIVAKKQKKS